MDWMKQDAQTYIHKKKLPYLQLKYKALSKIVLHD